MIKKQALGKGLSSLLPPPGQPAAPAERIAVTELTLDRIQINPNQPRKEFREDQLLELAQSIARDGIIQPLIVRKVDGKYELVAGERRYRAAKIAGLEKVPVVLHEVADEKLLEIALVENIQREDLNPMELAAAFERMSSELNLNHEEIGARTGKDRATITNAIRLLQLPKELQEMVSRRELTPGHARAVLKLRSEDEQRQLAQKIVEEGWTVRRAESYSSGPSGKSREAVSQTLSDPNIKAAIDQMERALGTKVRIVEKTSGKGKIEIEFYSSEDLDRIYSIISAN